jgi:hypothetical protein
VVELAIVAQREFDLLAFAYCDAARQCAKTTPTSRCEGCHPVDVG